MAAKLVAQLLLIWLICMELVFGQNETTTSSAPDTQTTTSFFTTSEPSSNPSVNPTFYPSVNPTSPTPGPTDNPTTVTTNPTLSPSDNPTKSPSKAPTITLEAGKDIQVEVVAALPLNEDFKKEVEAAISAEDTEKINNLQVGDEPIEIKVSEGFEATLTASFVFPAGCTEESCKVKVVKVTISPIGGTRRMLLAVETEMNVEFAVIFSDPAAFNEFEKTVEDGSFSENFGAELSEEYDIVVVVNDVESEYKGTGDGDVFLGNKVEETFGDKLASPFILLGLVTSLVGSVWLLFLRSKIENKYPSYLAAPAAGSKGTEAVEMVPQTSADQDGEKKKLNKEQLQEAWNSDNEEEVKEDK